MEAYIELKFISLDKDSETIKKSLSNIYVVVTNKVENKNSEYTIRYKHEKSIKIESNVGIIIENFLSSLENIYTFISKSEGYIRLGIFYNINETIVFPLILPTQCIKTMSNLNLYLDSTGYPCDDSESVQQTVSVISPPLSSL